MLMEEDTPCEMSRLTPKGRGFAFEFYSSPAKFGTSIATTAKTIFLFIDPYHPEHHFVQNAASSSDIMKTKAYGTKYASSIMVGLLLICLSSDRPVEGSPVSCT
jgi:hypothetical protein